MQQYFDIARIFKHYPGDKGYDVTNSQHQDALNEVADYYHPGAGNPYYGYGPEDDSDYDSWESDQYWENVHHRDRQRELEEEDSRRESANEEQWRVMSDKEEERQRREGTAAQQPDNTYDEDSQMGALETRIAQKPRNRPTYSSGKRIPEVGATPADGFSNMVKGDEYKLHQQGKMGGTEEIYSMGNRSKTQVQKMYRIFKAPRRSLADELDRQAQSSASVRGGPEGQGGTGSFEEAQNIGRGIIDQSISGIMYGRGGWETGGESSSKGTGRTEEEGLAPVPNNTPRTDTTQTSEQTQTPQRSRIDNMVRTEQFKPKPTPTGPAQNPMEQLGAKPKAGAGPNFKPRPAQQQYYSQDVKMVEKMARIFRV